MSDLLNSASLVMIPSGYKEDTVFSQIPTDGSGDLSFTRASNGTRINSAGLVEVVAWNFNTNSEDFITGWGTDGTSTATNNFATAPNGTTTAAKVVANTSGGYAYKNLSVSPNVYTLSLYIKASANTTMDLAINDVGGSGIGSQNFNVTTEWQRIEYDQNITAGSSIFIVYGAMNTGVNYFVWGAQLNIGATAKPYFPTTDRLNVPRLTYQNGGGGCPSLLLEKQSTNLVIQSQALTISTVNVGYTATDNNTTSPDGTQNASRVLEDTGTLHLIQKPYSVGSTTDYYTASFFVKSISRAKGKIVYGLDGAPYNSIEANFDLTAQTISSPTASGSGAVAGSSKIENFGNGWFRVSISGIVGISGTHYTRLVGLNDSGSDTYTGDGTKGFYAWGFQGEAGSYATSMINTTSSSATRVADACFKTGISSLIGQSQGTLFLDFVWNGHFTTYQSIEIFGNSNNRIGVYTFDSLNTIRWFIVGSGSVPFEQNISSALVIGQRYKMAIAYKSGDSISYINGSQTFASSATFSFNNALNDFYFQLGSGVDPFYQPVSQTILFPTRLTNAELASLTTI